MKGLIKAMLITQLITATQQTNLAAATVNIKAFSSWWSYYIKPVISASGSTWDISSSSGLNYRGSRCDDGAFVINNGSNYCYKDKRDRSGARLILLLGKRLIIRIFRAASRKSIDVTAECVPGSQLEIKYDIGGSWFSISHIDKRSFTQHGSSEWRYWLRCQTIPTTSSSFESSTKPYETSTKPYETLNVTTATNNASSEVINGTSSNSTTPTAETRTSNEQITEEHSGSGSPMQGTVTNDNLGGDNSNAAVIAGTGSAVIVLIIIGLLIFLILRRRKSKLSNSQAEQSQTDEYTYAARTASGPIQNSESEYNVLHERVRAATDDTYQHCDYSRTTESNAVPASKTADRVSYHFLDPPISDDTSTSERVQIQEEADNEDYNVLHERVTPSDPTYQSVTYAEVPSAARSTEANDRGSYHMVEIPEHEKTTHESDENGSIEESNLDDTIYENTTPKSINAARSSQLLAQTELKEQQIDEVELVDNDLYDGTRPDETDESVIYSLADDI